LADLNEADIGDTHNDNAFVSPFKIDKKQVALSKLRYNYKKDSASVKLHRLFKPPIDPSKTKSLFVNDSVSEKKQYCF